MYVTATIKLSYAHKLVLIEMYIELPSKELGHTQKIGLHICWLPHAWSPHMLATPCMVSTYAGYPMRGLHICWLPHAWSPHMLATPCVVSTYAGYPMGGLALLTPVAPDTRLDAKENFGSDPWGPILRGTGGGGSMVFTKSSG